MLTQPSQGWHAPCRLCDMVCMIIQLFLCLCQLFLCLCRPCLLACVRAWPPSLTQLALSSMQAAALDALIQMLSFRKCERMFCFMALSALVVQAKCGCHVDAQALMQRLSVPGKASQPGLSQQDTAVMARMHALKPGGVQACCRLSRPMMRPPVLVHKLAARTFLPACQGC